MLDGGWFSLLDGVAAGAAAGDSAIMYVMHTARRDAYEAVMKIGWDGEQHRGDIGWRALG